MHIATKVLIPLLRMCLAMCIVDAVNPAVSLQGFIQLIQKVTAWILGLMMAVFLGMLTVQSLVAVSADRAGTKAVKYVISGAVPIIGGAVSDAYSAVLGSVGVLRSGVGMVGILALCSLFMPALLNLGIYRLLMAVSSAVSGLFMADGLTRFFKNVECILATGFSVAVSFSVMFVFSSASVLLISGTLSP
jgi:stage III sporulation protein AE